MMSSRPLLPGARAPRAGQWRRWLSGTWPGRVLLFGLAVKLLTVAGARGGVLEGGLVDAIDAAGSLALLFAAGYAVARGVIWAKRRLLWRVRRKLILTYVFVGLVPGLLIIAFFLLAGLLLFFNVSSYLLQSRVRMLVDQAGFLAQAAVLEAEHGDPPDVLRRRLELRQRLAAERFPFVAMAIVPTSGLNCPSNGDADGAVQPRTMRVGPWKHLDAPARLPSWITCEGFAGLLAYEGNSEAGVEHRLVMRAVALPQTPTPRWAVVVDLPFSNAIETRLREETGIRLGEATALAYDDASVTIPRGRLLEPRPEEPDQGPTLGEGWVAFLQVHHWDTGAPNFATVAIRLNPREIYGRMAEFSAGRALSRLLIGVLAFIGALFLTIQLVALVIGFVLARQITGAVHDLFTGTEHLRNRDFTHQIPVRARDQLGELAESFNVMTAEVTKLLRENAEKARMEQEMLAAREIQRKLLPSGPLSRPGLAISAFCEPAREVAGDYYDLLPISDTALGVLIADVSGKGLPAGLYMAQLKVLVQSLARSHTSPREFLRAVNRVVADTVDSRSFITMAYGVVNLARREMVYARAGHCPLIHVPGSAPAGLRRSQILAPDGLVLGLKFDNGEMFDQMIQEETLSLGAGDLVVFFTDGISETMNEAFDCYGEERLARVLEQYAHLPFDQLRSYIFADLRAFAGGADQHDDMTMILLRVQEPAGEGV